MGQTEAGQELRKDCNFTLGEGGQSREEGDGGIWSALRWARKQVCCTDNDANLTSRIGIS
jgi:hypothetical protein